MAYAVGHISGGHFNPAITIGLATAKRFAWKDAPAYIVTQVVAALAASATLWVIAIGEEGLHPIRSAGGFARTATAITRPVCTTSRACFIIEVVLTAVFLIVIMGVTDTRARRVRCTRHRPVADAYPPRQHPGDQHLREPRSLHRPGVMLAFGGRDGNSANSGSSGSPRSSVVSSAHRCTARSPEPTKIFR